MGSARRIAVLGLYNSGSTGVAGLLHRLGVNMGAPFWEHSDDAAPNNYYEPYDVAWHLRRWWDEPRAVARAPAAERAHFLRCWAEFQQSTRPGPLGAKHPLLSLCADDLVAAWGPEVRFVWSWRPLEQSISGLRRRGWFGSHAEALQHKLWEALQDFEARRGDVVRLEWARVKADPACAARTLATLAGVEPTAERLQQAAGFIRLGP